MGVYADTMKKLDEEKKAREAKRNAARADKPEALWKTVAPAGAPLEGEVIPPSSSGASLFAPDEEPVAAIRWGRELQIYIYSGWEVSPTDTYSDQVLKGSVCSVLIEAARKMQTALLDMIDGSAIIGELGARSIFPQPGFLETRLYLRLSLLSPVNLQVLGPDIAVTASVVRHKAWLHIKQMGMRNAAVFDARTRLIVLENGAVKCEKTFGTRVQA